MFRAEDVKPSGHFPDKLPIAVDTDDRGHLFLYLVTSVAPVEKRWSRVNRAAETQLYICARNQTG